MTFTRTIVALTFTLLPVALFAQDSGDDGELTDAQRFYQSLNWEAGPGNFDVTNFATIDLPEGFDRLNESDTARLMEFF